MAYQHVPGQLVLYARQIALYNHYPVLEHGLQPVQDWVWDGVTYKGLLSKYRHECDELAEAVEKGDHLHVLSEAADVLYYGAQLNAQQPGHYWWLSAYSEVGRKGILMRHAMPAALAKYQYRASAPNRKDVETERTLIQHAIETVCDPN